MKKKLMIISIIFLSLITISYGSYTLLIDNYEKPELTRKDIADALEEELILLTYDFAEKTNPEYKTLDLSQIDVKYVNEIERSFSELLKRNYQNMMNDSLFDYWIVDSSGEIVKTNSQEEKISDISNENQLYGEISFDMNGIVELRDDSSNIDFSYPDRIIQHFYYDLSYEYDERELRTVVNSIEVENPRNFKLVYAIQESVNDESSLIRSIDATNQSNQFTSHSLLVLLSFSFFVILLIMFMPYNIVSDIEPFKTIDKMSFEILVFFYIGVFSSSFTAVLFSLRLILVDNLTLINDALDPVLVGSLLFVGYLLIAMIANSIKRIFKEGFGPYFKNNTLLIKGIRRVNNKVNKMISLPLETELNKKIFTVVGTVIILMSCLALFGPVGSVLILIAGIVIIYKTLHETSRVLEEYDTTLNVVKEIAQGNFKDLSELTSKRSVLSTLNNELLEIQNGFEAAVKKERQAQDMRTELITNVSHDLKTPITGIQSYVELLEDEVVDNDIIEYISQIKQYTTRLNILIQDVFDLSEVNSGSINLDFQEVDIVSLIEQVEGEFETSLANKNLKVIWDNLTLKSMCYLDGDKTYRIFENLFSNISKYAMPHSRVYISIMNDDKKVSIEIKNTSEKIILVNKDDLKERFIRGETSRTVQGNGLGLSIAESFTEAQGGIFDIVVDGDLFKVLLEFKVANQGNYSGLSTLT